MNLKSSFRILFMFFVSALVVQYVAGEDASSLTLIFEIQKEGEMEGMTIPSHDVVKVGINERLGDIRVEVKIAEVHHAVLNKLTKNNIGNKLIIRTEDETLFAGTIFEPLERGIVAFPCSSESEAKTIISKIGREPDYHLKLKPEDIDASKIYRKPARNPWGSKAIYAHTNRDFAKAERFAKKAIESEPIEPAHHLLLSAIYYDQGKKELALEELLKAETLSKKEVLSKFPGTYLSIAGLYADFNEYEKAIEYFNNVLSTNDRNLQALLGVAQVYEKIGQKNLALKNYFLLSESDDRYFQEKGLEGLKRLQEK